MERCIAFVLIAWGVAVVLLIIRYQLILDKMEYRYIRHPEDPLAQSLEGQWIATKKPTYGGNYYYQVAKHLYDKGIIDADALITELDKDPFVIRGGPGGFRCPTTLEERLDYPNLVNFTRADVFRTGDPNSWIFYQHLRKAGGTGFW